MNRPCANAALILAILLLSCGPNPRQELTETHKLLGTAVTITVNHDDPAAAQRAAAAAFAEIERIERLFSTHDEESEISRLNRDGAVRASAETLFAVEEALRFGRISSGAFDMTVMPLLDLYRESFSAKGRAPGKDEIERALALVDPGGVIIEGDTISLRRGMKITLDGIGKGYVIDRAIEVLIDHGIGSALVNAGGDMRCLGEKEGRPWKIALQNPRDRRECVAVLSLTDRAVATSGDYERYFDPDKKFHHIIDPRTGQSAAELISVTVTAATALEADALATAIFVLGPEKGFDLAERLPGVEAFLITREREIEATPGLGVATLAGR